jgi:hypothetical protein
MSASTWPKLVSLAFSAQPTPATAKGTSPPPSWPDARLTVERGSTLNLSEPAEILVIFVSDKHCDHLIVHEQE